MAKLAGQVELNGKKYLITDGSYQSRMLPMFRPQESITGVSREALDQYLYWTQETWDEGTNKDSIVGVWSASSPVQIVDPAPPSGGGGGGGKGTAPVEDRGFRTEPNKGEPF